MIVCVEMSQRGDTDVFFSSRGPALTRHVPEFNSTTFPCPSFLTLWCLYLIHTNQNIIKIQMSIMVVVLCANINYVVARKRIIS